MNLNKKSARERWNDPAFQGKVMLLVSALAKDAVALADVDMAGVAIGKTGPFKELWSTNLYQANLEDADMSYADLACSLSETNLQRVLLVGADLDRCLVRKARVVDCDLSNAKLVVNLDDSIFENCKFKGATFSGGKAGAEYGGRRVKFIGCDFSDVIFKRVEFRASQFVDCVFDGTRFIGCDFRGVKAEGGALPLASQFEKMDAPAWAISGIN